MKAFRQGTLDDYLNWLRLWLVQGNQPTHYYDYPFSKWDWLVAQRDFTTGGECGTDAANIIVPQGIHHVGGDLGHNTLYLIDGPSLQGDVVPVFEDEEFYALSRDVIDFIEAKKTKRTSELHEAKKRRQESAARLRASDIGQWMLNKQS